MADFNDVEQVPFQLDSVVFRNCRGDSGLGDLARKELVPNKLAHRHIAVHLVDSAGGGNDFGTESVGERAGREPVVAVSVGDEDVGEVLAARLYPVPDGAALVKGERRVDKNSVVITMNQSGRQWRPHRSITVGRRLGRTLRD